jgi:hypothetical protein
MHIRPLLVVCSYIPSSTGARAGNQLSGLKQLAQVLNMLWGLFATGTLGQVENWVCTFAPTLRQLQVSRVHHLTNVFFCLTSFENRHSWII